MRLSTRGRYAVMAVVDLAASGRGGPVALADIAERQEISLPYLEQLFAKLRKGGLVRGVRGPGGGYVLARPAEALAVGEIVQAVDEPIRATRCGAGAPGGCRADGTRCRTHDLWEELGEQIRRYLGDVSVADVVAGRVRRPAAGAAGPVPDAGETAARGRAAR